MWNALHFIEYDQSYIQLKCVSFFENSPSDCVQTISNSGKLTTRSIALLLPGNRIHQLSQSTLSIRNRIKWFGSRTKLIITFSRFALWHRFEKDVNWKRMTPDKVLSLIKITIMPDAHFIRMVIYNCWKNGQGSNVFVKRGRIFELHSFEQSIKINNSREFNSRKIQTNVINKY